MNHNSQRQKRHIVPIDHYITNDEGSFKSWWDSDTLFSSNNAVNYSTIGFDITIKRSISKYLWSYYFPSILVVLIAGCSFIIPPNAIPGRMSLLVTLFLVQMGLIQGLQVKLCECLLPSLLHTSPKNHFSLKICISHQTVWKCDQESYLLHSI